MGKRVGGESKSAAVTPGASSIVPITMRSAAAVNFALLAFGVHRKVPAITPGN
jgi:hypothetical protein